MSHAASVRTLAVAAAMCLAAVYGTAADTRADPRLQEADLAWDRGDYPAALREYLALLDSEHADRLLPAVALQTGELFHSLELTADGSSPQFSPDGRHLAYEVGRGANRRTRVAPVGTPAATVELPGHGAAFAPDASTVAYLDAAGTVTLEDRSTGIARVVHTGGRPAIATLPAVDGIVLFTSPDTDGFEQVHAAREGSEPAVLTRGAPAKTLRAINATGTAVLFTRRSLQPGELPVFGIISLPQLSVSLVEGSAPAFSADGQSLVFVRQVDGLTQLLAAPVSAPAAATLVRAGPEPMDAPALSQDGSRIAFQIMAAADWELHVVDRDGSGERRVTREIQHDVAPRFLTPDRVLGLMGEPRHRRSFMYDLTAGTRTRLFHNNTVRTIAPEYQWTPSPDGTKLLIVADRNGDTISPARGVYLMDLNRTVTREALRARLVASLAAEDTLRATGRRLFAPVADLVQRVVAEASLARIVEYQQALFAFGSKHISRPGNRLAAAYLFETYQSFGYEPEYQPFDTPSALGGTTANVLATLEGTLHPELVYVVSSHYDSVPESPGADDNASGTAALLETARMLAGRPLPATVVFASFTAEESGLLGSREFVRRALAAGTRIVGALNNDMIGWANDHRLDNTVRFASPGIRDVQHGAAIQFTRLITYDARYFRGTDAHAFHEAYGSIFGGIGSYPVLGNPHYHQPHDLLHTINHELVSEVAKTTVASLILLASSPSPVTGLRVRDYRDGRASLSWAPSPERDVTGYLVEWSAPAGGQTRQVRVTDASAVLQAPPGTTVSVKPVNGRGLAAWDSTQLVIPD